MSKEFKLTLFFIFIIVLWFVMTIPLFNYCFDRGGQPLCQFGLPIMAIYALLVITLVSFFVLRFLIFKAIGKK